MIPRNAARACKFLPRTATLRRYAHHTTRERVRIVEVGPRDGLQNEKAVIPLFESLDRLENILQGKDYLIGNQLTEADIRLFVTIVRHVPKDICPPALLTLGSLDPL